MLQIETGAFDLIVLDIMLPGMDGLSCSPRSRGDAKENEIETKSRAHGSGGDHGGVLGLGEPGAVASRRAPDIRTFHACESHYSRCLPPAPPRRWKLRTSIRARGSQAPVPILTARDAVSGRVRVLEVASKITSSSHLRSRNCWRECAPSCAGLRCGNRRFSAWATSNSTSWATESCAPAVGSISPPGNSRCFRCRCGARGGPHANVHRRIGAGQATVERGDFEWARPRHHRLGCPAAIVTPAEITPTGFPASKASEPVAEMVSKKTAWPESALPDPAAPFGPGHRAGIRRRKALSSKDGAA